MVSDNRGGALQGRILLMYVSTMAHETSVIGVEGVIIPKQLHHSKAALSVVCITFQVHKAVAVVKNNQPRLTIPCLKSGHAHFFTTYIRSRSLPHLLSCLPPEKQAVKKIWCVMSLHQAVDFARNLYYCDHTYRLQQC